jgi:putative effector of murein hydrolase LrgA (UPF0299 family)
MKDIFLKLCQKGMVVLAKELKTDGGKINIWTTLLATLLTLFVIITEPIEAILNWILRALNRDTINFIPMYIQVMLIVGTFAAFFWCLFIVSKHSDID